MKRAAVWRGAHATWWACTVPAALYEPDLPMPMRAAADPEHEHEPFPTHEAALAHALAEVGLTEKNTEKEKGREV